MPMGALHCVLWLLLMVRYTGWRVRWLDKRVLIPFSQVMLLYWLSGHSWLQDHPFLLYNWGVSRKLATFEKMTNRHESQRFECAIIALSIYV